MRQFVLDTETTGLDPSEGHRLIEVGLIEIADGSVSNFYYHQYFNTERRIDPGAVEVHGITNEFLAPWPSFKEEGRTLLNIIDGHELIIHNAPFDLGFLNNEISLTMPGEPPLEQRCRITDTLLLARKLHPGQRNSCSALIDRYRVDVSIYEDAYAGALYDAVLLAQIFLKMRIENDL
jgi:DNA polymerase-3 subunit epsilon